MSPLDKLDLPTVDLHSPAGNCETQAGAACLGKLTSSHPIEPFKDKASLVFRDDGGFIFHFDACRMVAQHPHAYMAVHRSEADRVIENIRDSHFQNAPVGAARSGLYACGEFEGLLLFLRKHAKESHHVLYILGDVDYVEAPTECSRL